MKSSFCLLLIEEHESYRQLLPIDLLLENVQRSGVTFNEI